MNALTGKVAQIVFAIPFAVFGIFHFMNADQMAGYISGFPMPKILIYVVGVALILAFVAIVFDKMKRTACLLLALLLLIIILSVHMPGMGNEATAQMSMMALLKDFSMMGGALMLAGISSNK